MKIILSVAIFLFMSDSALGGPDATLKADNQAINSACSNDAKTAGCSGEVVGKGLLKCLWAYKKANKSYKFTDSCQSAMKQRRSDKAASQ